MGNELLLGLALFSICCGRLFKYGHGVKGSTGVQHRVRGRWSVCLDFHSRLSHVGEKRCRGPWAGTLPLFSLFIWHTRYAPHYYYYHHPYSPDICPTLPLSGTVYGQLGGYSEGVASAVNASKAGRE